MTCERRCNAVSEKKLAAAVEAEHTRLQELLAESCTAARPGQDWGIRPALSARLEEFQQYFLPAYTRADLSARHFRAAYARASTAVFTLGALAVIIVAAQYFFHLPHPLVVGEVLCIGLILIIFHWGNHSRWHRNWVDCRYFAERVRCGLYVAFLCGKTAVPEAMRWSDRIVEGAWCNAEFEALMSERPHPDPLDEKSLPVLRHFMVTHWLRYQLNYHESVARRKMRKHVVVSRIGETCFWLTLVTALLHLTPHAWRHDAGLDHVLADGLLTFIVIALPAIGTALAGVRGHFEFKKIATRAHMIALQLESLIADAGEVRDLEGLALVVLRAEELMIQENAGWHLHAGSKVIPADP